jgi:hypothetical protein
MFNYFKPQKNTFNSQLPFPYFAEKDLWDIKALKLAEKEFESFDDWDGQKKFKNSMWKKYCGTYLKFPLGVKKIIDFALSDEFVKWIQDVSGIENLVVDHTFLGAGMHQTSNGGFLDMHADFNYNEDLKLYRRLNLLIYLNSDWLDSYGGFLEIEDKNHENKKIIKPEINMTVLFVTDDDSIHGHPIPMILPENITRKSIALYYYTKEKPDKGHYGERTGTEYYSKNVDNTSFLNKIFKVFKK